MNEEREMVSMVEGRVISGDVAVQDCTGASLELINGDVAVLRVAGPVDVSAKSGDVAVGQAQSREVRVRTLSGDVAVDLIELNEGAVDVETVSGDIKLTIPPQARASVEAVTRSGDVHCALPLREQSRNARSLRGVLNEPGATVRLQAISGDVHIRGHE